MKHKCTVILGCGLALTFRLIAQVILPQDLQRGLDISLALHGNGMDDLGRHNAEILGNVTFVPDRFGASNSAAFFSGDLSEVIVATNLPSQTTTNVTVTAWVRTAITNQTMQLLLKSHYPDSSDEQWTLFIQSGIGLKPQLGFGIKRNSGGVPQAGWHFVVSGSTLPIGGSNWTFLSATWDGSTATVYVNGTPIGSTSSIPPGGIDTFSTGDLIVGRSPYAASPTPFIGDINQIMIYDRSLSQLEISELYTFQKIGPQSSAPTNGLIAYYPLSGDTRDYSGSGYDGFPTNIVSAPDRFGLANGAFYFSGTNSFIDLGNPPAFNFRNDFSLSIWVKATTPQIGTYFLGKYSAFSMNAYGLGTSDFAVSYAFMQNGSFPSGAYLEGGPEIGDGSWHHILATFQRTNAASLYVDGSLVATNLNTRNNLNPLINADHLLIGQITTGQGFQGYLDDVRIYARALTESEALELFVYESTDGFYSNLIPSLPAGLTNAVATANISSGSVVSIPIIISGAGYTVAPQVTLTGGGGSGAEAIAILSNGSVVSIIVINPGFGYTSAPAVTIESPSLPPSLAVKVNTLALTETVTPGKTYILESTTDGVLWSPVGASFVATISTITNVVPATLTEQLFRIRQLPTP